MTPLLIAISSSSSVTAKNGVVSISAARCCCWLARDVWLGRHVWLSVIEGSFDILSRARYFRKFAVATFFRLSFAANQPPTSMWMELVYFKYRFRNLHLYVEDTLPQRSASRSRIYPSSLCGAMCLVHQYLWIALKCGRKCMAASFLTKCHFPKPESIRFHCNQSDVSVSFCSADGG